jgi:hypothetical protein
MPPSWAVWLVVAVVGVAAVAVMAIVFIPAHAVPEAPKAVDRDRLAAQAAIRGTILQTLAGLVVIVGLGFTARSVYLSRETHLTDRLAKAVDQLGSDKPEVRVGGVYALQRLAGNSRVDRTVIADILSGYLTIHVGPAATPPTSVAADVQTALTVLWKLHA